MSSSKFDDASWWRFPVISSGFPASTGWTAACWLGLFFTAIMGVTQEATIQAQTPASGRQRPNIVYLLCDDLGVGDLRSFNAESKIATPHLDRLAAEGMRLTDAHSGSAVCTPTRYGILCGRYAWRTRLQNGVLGGLSPSLIAADQWTVAKHVKQAGYHSACIGKWHLGLDWQRVDGKEVAELAIESQAQNRNVQFDKPFAGGPLAAGFDEYFGISASLDMVPYVYLKDRAVTVLPTVEKSFGMKFAGDNNQTRPGPGAPDFTADDVLPRLTAEAVGYIERRAATSAAEPFFLYVPFASPHTPIAPSKTWEGKSGLNPYADFVMQQDYCVGQIMQALVRANIDQNTIVFFTSDNGCSPQADLPALRQKGHDPCFPYRGHKADIFEGGHRVPMIVRWPGKIAANTQSAHTVCLTDLLATVADIIGHPLPEQAGPDSFSWWPTLQGQQVESIRPYTIHHSINGSFAIRRGPYKLCLCADSGGWSDPKPNAQRAPTEALQLYNLDKDIAESANLAGEEPKVVRELAQLLEQSVRQGRSTAGPALNNDVPVDPWKHSRRPNSLD